MRIKSQTSTSWTGPAGSRREKESTKNLNMPKTKWDGAKEQQIRILNTNNLY